MIEFIPFGLLLGVPIGFGFFRLARRKGRRTWVWGPSMCVLAALWLAGAAALPSVARGDRTEVMSVVFLTAGCFLVQVVLSLYLVMSGDAGTDSGTAGRKRVAILLAIMGLVLALSVVFAFVL